MRRRRVDSGLEQQYLIAMATSTPFLSAIAPHLDLSLLKQGPIRQVASWCLDYWRRYREAPGRALEAIYRTWEEKEDPDEDVAAAVADFLGHLSSQYDQAPSLNVRHLIDSFGEFIQMAALSRLNDQLSEALLNGDRATATHLVESFSTADLGPGMGINPLADRSAWERTFADPEECLISFEGDAGQFFNSALTRDALIAIQGPEKRGKTFWCIEFAYRALIQGRKVAFFEVGDLSERQLLLRFGARFCSRPIRKVGEKKTLRIPKSIVVRSYHQGNDTKYLVEVVETRKIRNAPITQHRCLMAARRITRYLGAGRAEPRLMVSIHPNSSINVMGIEGVLDRWEHEKGFVPDVIVVDYPDILLPEGTKKDFRHEVNDTWKALRRLSQTRHCLVLAPTQASAAAYDSRTQTMRHYSEDKRKLAHVTGMLGLNQQEDEKESKVMRLNWIVLRESDFRPGTVLWVAQELSIARAFCCATMHVEGQEDDESMSVD